MRRGHKLILVNGRPTPYLAGFIYPVLGEHEKAAEEAQKAIELTPDFGVGYALLVPTLLASTVWEEPKTRFAELPSERLKSLC